MSSRRDLTRASRSHPRALAGIAASLAALAVLAGAPAAGAESLSTVVSVPEAADRSCTDRDPSGRGVASRSLTSPSLGVVRATLSGASGDWDLAVLDASSGRTVAASASAGSDELAEGFVLAGQELVVQACRRAGGGGTATLDVDFPGLGLVSPEPLQLVRVSTPTEGSKQKLLDLGLDVTEHAGPDFVDVVLHGPEQATLLRKAGFGFEVRVDDLVRQAVRQRLADRAYAGSVRSSALPSGRTTYRRLFDYSEEMKQLAKEHPKLVRRFTLPLETYEGRPVEGIEIASRVRVRDGRPVFLLMGLHHAREWPSGEHTMEWAHELLNGYMAGNDRVRRLMRGARTILIPVVNPDGFNVSREAGELAGAGGGRGGVDETANLVIPYEYQRKNCRNSPPLDESAGGSCTQQPATGLLQFGVDPNRNYGGFWGGDGASPPGGVPPGEWAQDYRGPGPFSEPETENIRRLVSRRQVTTLITNHTFSNLILRPPGAQAHGKSPDESIYRRLGAAMAAENGYANQFGWELYDTTGTTEDWTYWATGGLGYTFEIGPSFFHPPFADTVAEYRGTTEAAGKGGGNRGAFFKAMRSTAITERHSLLAGRAPKGAVLTLTKRFRTPTSPVVQPDGTVGDRIWFKDRLRTKMRVPRSGRFRWHVNPSTRPLVAERPKAVKPRPGKPSDPASLSGAPGPSAIPCADFDTEDETCWNDHPFRVPGGKGIDNGTATVRIQWPSIASDWDMKIFRDSDGDGTSVGEKKIVGSSAAGTTDFEQATIARPGLRRGRYVVRVVNFAAVEPYEGTVTFAKTPKPDIVTKVERWTLTCRRTEGSEVLAKREVRVDRGERVSLDLRRSCRR